MSEAMSGLEQKRQRLAVFRWRDAILERVSVTYDDIAIVLTESGGRTVILRCIGHLAFGCEWHWDESVVEDVQLVDGALEIDAAKRRVRDEYGPRPKPGGGTRDIEGAWFRLTVRLIDGEALWVVTQSLEIETEQIGVGGR